MDEKATIRFVLIGVKYSQSDLGKHYKTFCGLYLGMHDTRVSDTRKRLTGQNRKVETDNVQ